MMRAASIACGLVLIFSATSLRAADEVAVEILEGIPDKKDWGFTAPVPTERYAEPAFGLVATPRKYNARGLLIDRSNPFVVQATGKVTLTAGEYRLLLRSRGAARLLLDGRVLLQTDFLKPNAGGHENVPDAPGIQEEGLATAPVGHQEKLLTLKIDEGTHEFRLQTFVGGQKLRHELGEPLVGIARGKEKFRLLSPSLSIALTDEGWSAYASARRTWHRERDTQVRHAAGADEQKFWQRRHEWVRQSLKNKPAGQPPDIPKSLLVHNDIDRFIGQKLAQLKVQPAPLTDDYAFLRRVSLDTVGMLPTRTEIDAFINDKSPDRRVRVIDRLLADGRWADHWVSYWQDVLAENPGILKPTLNNTGPFRWYLHQALLDNWSVDRFVTELVMMDGSKMGGGPAGFAMASQNDSPMAAKAHVLAKAFLGIELSCARCHDAPHHPFKQKDTFSLAALLAREAVTIPATSSVKPEELARRPLIEVTLAPGSKVDPAWPFLDLAPAKLPAELLRNPEDPRERLAATLTSPANERFAQVVVNRLWKRYLGWGLVEPVDDWNGEEPSHPELLRYLAQELVTHDYDLKHVARLILGSHTYQRAVTERQERQRVEGIRLFASPARRRLSAEQLLDTLFQVAGKEFQSEELNIDPEGRRPITEMLNLGAPRRAWEFTSLSNERDRPALSLPAAQSIVDVLTRFGWRESRQNPITVREETPTPLQPLILANGVVGSRITRLSEDSGFTELCLQDLDVSEMVRAVFLQVLSRPPTPAERELFAGLLQEGFSDRRMPGYQTAPKKVAAKPVAVSWANHLSPEASKIKLELERKARLGDPPSDRLRRDWRERMEDMLWALVNSPEFMFVP